jgi:hypothetical protein
MVESTLDTEDAKSQKGEKVKCFPRLPLGACGQTMKDNQRAHRT